LDFTSAPQPITTSFICFIPIPCPSSAADSGCAKARVRIRGFGLSRAAGAARTTSVLREVSESLRILAGIVTKRREASAHAGTIF